MKVAERDKRQGTVTLGSSFPQRKEAVDESNLAVMADVMNTVKLLWQESIAAIIDKYRSEYDIYSSASVTYHQEAPPMYRK